MLLRIAILALIEAQEKEIAHALERLRMKGG
jgi:hypothetical protein